MIQQLGGLVLIARKKAAGEGVYGMIKQAREHKKLKNLAMVEKILKNVEFFGSLKKRLNDAKMKELVSQLGYKTAIKGEYLYNKGDKEDYFYIIINGRIAIEKVKDKELEKIRELTNGDSFGELSLSEATSTRKFNAVALEDSQMATLDKKSFMRAFESIRSQISKQVDDLQKNSLFNNDWSNLTLMGMAFTFNVMEVKKDTFLYREGDIATEVYFLRSGQVECSRKLPLTQKDQDDEYQISPRRLKWAHISLWTDFALFGYEEFYRINVLEADNVLKTIVKREVNVEVISEKAEIWSMNAQRFFDYFKDNRTKMQDLVSLMEQRLTRRAELYQKTLKLTGNQSEQTYKPKLEPIQPYQTKIEKAKVHRKNPSSTNEVPKLVIREFDTVDFAEINQKNIKKFDYLQFENKILEAKDNIRDLKNRKNLGPSRPFFSKSDIDKFLNNSAESSVSNKGMFSIDSRDSKVSFPNVLLEYSPKSPRAIEIDNKMAVKSPIKGSLKPLHQRDVEPPPPRAKPNSPVFKPYDKINLTYDRINTSYELEEDLISEVSSVKLSSVKHSRSPSFFTNFNQKLTILEPLDLKRIENLKQHQTIQTSTNDQSSRIMISSPRPPFKSPFKGYLEHKEHQKKYIKWINPLKFKQIQDELVKKNPLKNPSNSSFVLNFNTLG